MDGGGGGNDSNRTTPSSSQQPRSAFRPKTGPVPPPLPPPPPQQQRYAPAGDASPARTSSSLPFAGDAGHAQRSFVPLPQRGHCAGPNSDERPPAAAVAAAHGRGRDPPRPVKEPLAELSNLSDDDLQDLLDDDEALRVYFDELGWVKDMQLVHEELQAGNETIARRNLAKQEELVRLKEAIAEQQRSYAALRAQFDRKLDEQNRFLKRYEPQRVVLRLKSTFPELDAQSERYADDFVRGKMDVTEFIVKFREARKTYHLRAAKAETLAKR